MKSFVLHADCEVIYNGRASSKLKRGYYLVIRKEDGSLLIHGAAKMTPLNYQSPGASLQTTQNKIISTRKNETIEIVIYKAIKLYEMDDWTDGVLEITKTEEELKQKIIMNIETILGESIIEVHDEYDTPYGQVDVLAITATTWHVIEVKRGKASLSACTQVLRYLGHFHEKKHQAKGWIMSPDISKNAMSYCEKHQLLYRKITH